MAEQRSLRWDELQPTLPPQPSYSNSDRYIAIAILKVRARSQRWHPSTEYSPANSSGMRFSVGELISGPSIHGRGLAIGWREFESEMILASVDVDVPPRAYRCLLGFWYCEWTTGFYVKVCFLQDQARSCDYEEWCRARFLVRLFLIKRRS